MRRWAILLASILSVASPPPAVVPEVWYPHMSAHRGGLAAYPENTLTAFKRVQEEHPNMSIEFDVRALKDGTLVLHHDATVNGTKLNNMTKAEWAKQRVADPAGGTAPATTLAEVLEEFGGTDAILVPELKDVAAVDAFIHDLWPYRGQVVAQSSNTGVVSRLVRTGFRTLQLSSAPITPVKGVYAVGIRHTAITQDVVDDAHHQGVVVWAWTVNSRARVAELFGMGVDAVITDDPTL